MQNLPTIENIETLLEEEFKSGNIGKGLEKDLIHELMEINLLDQLVRSRVEKFVSKSIEINQEENTEGENEKQTDVISLISHQWFENRLDKYYLEKRDQYERVSFQMFRTMSKGIANEAYQRLIEGEESWKSVNERWGTDTEKENEGKYVQIRISNINRIIYKALRRLKEGEISQPFRTGKLITIVKLIKWRNVELNKDLKKVLEKEMYADWIIEKTKAIVDRMT